MAKLFAYILAGAPDNGLDFKWGDSDGTAQANYDAYAASFNGTFGYPTDGVTKIRYGVIFNPFTSRSSTGGFLSGTITSGPLGSAAPAVAPTIHSVSLGSPAALSTTTLLSAQALTASAQLLVAAAHQPDVPRTWQIVGNAAGIAGNITAHGLDASGALISETLALNGSTPVIGTMAFASYTGFDLPIQTHAGTDTVSIGTTAAIGIGDTLYDNTVITDLCFNNGTKETTAGTVVTNVSVLSKNVITFNSSLAGHPLVVGYLK